MKRRWLVCGGFAWAIGYAGALLLPSESLRLLAAIGGVLAVGGLLIKRWRLIALYLMLTILAGFYYIGIDSRNVCTVCLAAGDALQQEELAATLVGMIDSPVTVDGDQASFVLALRSMKMGEGPAIEVKDRLQVHVRLLERVEQEKASGWKRADPVMLSGTLALPQKARNFDGFDYRQYLRLHRIHALVSVKGANAVQSGPPDRAGVRYVLRLFDGLRSRMTSSVTSVFPPDQSGYMTGLLLGDDSGMDPQQYGQFTTLGLTHVLAISGMHVGVLVAVLLWIFRRLRVARETGIGLTIAVLPFYIVLTGASPSVVRAGAMGMIGLYLYRRGILHTALDLTVGIGWAMLLWNPYYMLDVGFQLSFAVTLGLILAMPKVQKLLPGRFPKLEGSVALTLVAQLISFPLSILYFNQFSLLSWLANMLLVPIISFVVTPLGGAALLASLVSGRIGSWLAWPVLQLNELTFAVTKLLSTWRAPVLLWPSPPLWWLIVYYGGLAAWLGALWRRKEKLRMEREGILLAPPIANSQSLRARRWIRLLLPLALTSGMLVYSYWPNASSREGTIEFLDVGQGDSIYIRTPEGMRILIDGGGTLNFHTPGDDWKARRDPFEVGRKLVAPLLKKRGVHRLDLVFATHEDADHIGGLQAIVEQFPVSRFAFNGTLKETVAAKQLFATIVDHKIPLWAASEGERLQLDRFTTLEVLAPSPLQSLETLDKQNTRSVVLLLTMYGKRILLTGDMEAPEEEDVLSRLEQPEQGAEKEKASVASAVKASSTATAATIGPIDLLKVAHHGSKTSTTAAWLAYWQPQTAVISVGAHNLYGHPSPIVTDRLRTEGIRTLRTDEQGEVRVRINPVQPLQIETMLPGPVGSSNQ